MFGLEKRTQRIPIAKYLKACAAAKGANQEDPVCFTKPLNPSHASWTNMLLSS
jgi:hypothetical protein